jgi:hypothetical protein
MRDLAIMSQKRRASAAVITPWPPVDPAVN